MTPVLAQWELGTAFCSYCGCPPAAGVHPTIHRVCNRCELGIVLCAAARDMPSSEDPFVIVNRGLLVQALSRQTEAILGVREHDWVGVPLYQFLTCDALERLVALAIAGTPWMQTLHVQTAGGPRISLGARVSRCGPPPAALLLLTPPPGRAPAPPSRHRRATIDRCSAPQRPQAS